jgi:hypothetical protein
MTEEVRPGVRQIVSRAVGNVVGDFNLLHLITIDRMGTKIARNC